MASTAPHRRRHLRRPLPSKNLPRSSAKSKATPARSRSWDRPASPGEVNRTSNWTTTACKPQAPTTRCEKAPHAGSLLLLIESTPMELLRLQNVSKEFGHREVLAD